jgi:hypothetical protein
MSLHAATLRNPIPTDPSHFAPRPPVTAPVQDVLRQAQDELHGLLQQRADLMKRIGTVKQTISGLASLFGDEILSDELLHLVDRKPSGRQPGFTHACRVLLMEAGRPLTVREVCARMSERMPAVLGRHKDPLASLTTVLNRLVEYGEAQSLLDDHGRRSWLWIAENQEAASKEEAAK